MVKVKILVSCHKETIIRKGDLLLPIHVGHALSDEDFGFIGDDTGNNISKKNPLYCELTSQYWAWKNLEDVDVIGFCHYRRYFPSFVTEQKIEPYLYDKKYDIIAARTSRFLPIHEKWTKYVSSEDLVIMMKIVQQIHPDYADTLTTCLWGNQMCSFNMLIMRKLDFDKYSEWLFSILNGCERYIKLSPYSRGKRVFGYLGEILLYVYCMHNNMKIKSFYVEDVHPSTSYSLHWLKNWTLFTISDISYALSLVKIRKYLQKYQSIEDLIYKYYKDQVIGLRNDGIDLFDN